MTNLSHALTYAELGWPIFPVWPMRDGVCGCAGLPTCDGGRNAGKHPINRLAPKGHLNATTDAETIRRWWTIHPEANIALHCAGAGIVVVDVDPRNGGDETWPELDLPDSTIVATTGGGGFHQFYSAPAGEWHGLKLPGIDLKFNGYVILPPSNHRSGDAYAWRPGCNPQMIIPLLGLPDLPECFIDDMSFQSGGTYADEPLNDLTDKDVNHWLSRLGDHRWVYDSWVKIGSALHHQYRGAAQGLAIWESHSKQRPGYEKDTITTGKWRSFGRNSRIRPTTFRTIIEWAQEDARERLIDEFDEVDNDEFDSGPPSVRAAQGVAGGGVTASPPIRPGAEQDSPPAPHLDLYELFGLDRPTADEIDAPGADPIDAIEGAPAAGRADRDWMRLLDITEDGAIRSTLPNLTLILAHDPRTAGLPQLNEFTQETVQRQTPGIKPPRRKGAAKPVLQLGGRIWEVGDRLNGTLWSDDRDFSIRSIIEAEKTQGGYGIKVTDRDLKAAVTLVANENPFHPIREYLNALAWDGVARVETLFIKYLGAEDNPYSRQVARLMMLGAVARVFEPGHKFDFAVIIEGLQGRRKSTFIKILGRHWFAELDGDFHDQKMMIELMQGAWILELPELSGFSRADVKAIKAFMSRGKDRARLAYARRAGEFPRQCIFIGSTNDRAYLRDDTGGRRFWPMPCSVTRIDTEAFAAEVDQFWAEAVNLYREMRIAHPIGDLPLFLTGRAEEIALELQEDRREENEADGLAGEISVWLDKPVSDGGFDEGSEQRRDIVCLRQIWVEMLGNDRRTYPRADQLTLGKAMSKVPGWKLHRKAEFPTYGPQKAYVRISPVA